MLRGTMAKSKVDVPEILPTSPINLTCPFCKAAPSRDCMTTSGGFAAIHVARIQAAAAIDRGAKRKAS
jgi:hypothetical protein